MRWPKGLLLVALLAAAPAPAHATDGLKINVLSNRADLISGGDALVAIELPDGVEASALRVRVEQRVKRKVRRRSATRAFASREGDRIVGLVTGLPLGRSTLRATAGGRRAGIAITNHPNGGPVFSGPQVQPWVCQKTAVDAQCNQPPKFELLYRSTDPDEAFLRYDPDRPRPRDLAMTTTDRGVRVPFVIRVETGYQDRDQYKIATLFQPGKPWEPWAPQEQWNRKLVITHGGGCGVSYRAGNAPSVISDNLRTDNPLFDELAGLDSISVALGRGFAVMSTALNNNGHNCNIVTQAESMMMAKEHLVETYGQLRYTIGIGCSGGSLTEQQVANAYPGIYQGLVATCSFPDSWSSAAQVADYKLLRAYFENSAKADGSLLWTPMQWADVEGHVLPINAAISEIGYFSAFQPTNACGGVSDQQRYHPQTNPGGVRCGVPDYMINVVGPRPPDVWSPVEKQIGRSFAGVGLGNTGVQYGLGSLQRGMISPAQFVDLNADVGAFDIDINPTTHRLAADRAALRNVYRSGAINSGNNLGGVAIINHEGPDPAIAHDAYRTFAMRARIQRAQGHHRNHVVWFGHVPVIGDTTYGKKALLAVDRWLTAVERDHSSKSLAEKVAEDKPADIQDRCSQIPGVELVAVPGVGKVCEQSFVMGVYGTPRMVGGASIHTDINECQLKPLNRADYGRVTFSDEEWARLQQAFPTGVCDWSKPGLEQTGTIPWMTYQERNGKVIYGGRPLARAPARSGAGWASEAFSDWRD